MSATASVQDHYDAVRTVSRKDRARGDLFRLKKFHNGAKRLLIEKYAVVPGTMLDIACGRGGDLRKWPPGLRVKGIDISPNEIAEAVRRRDELGLREEHEFEVVDVKTASVARVYDSVSAMFCMHYFFESEEVLRNVLVFVSGSLRRGGKFFGCCPDERMVRTFPGSTYARITFVADNAYVFHLDDSVLENAEIIEYCVDFGRFKSVAASCGLEFIASAAFNPEEAYPGVEITRLFRTFVFVRV
jgi:mRNA (guanine-N7-)-methyltransferase